MVTVTVRVRISPFLAILPGDLLILLALFALLAIDRVFLLMG